MTLPERIEQAEGPSRNLRGQFSPEPRCVNAHDLCHGGAAAPCVWCEVPGDRARARAGGA